MQKNSTERNSTKLQATKSDNQNLLQRNLKVLKAQVQDLNGIKA